MIPRRYFLETSALAAGAATLQLTSGLRAQSANGKLAVGIIGPGGMGSSHLRTLARSSEVSIAAVCDVDANRLASAVNYVTQAGWPAPRAHTDLRRVLEDQSIDAVFIATPDHWHAPAAILAVEAGKHVYVEKPASHNIREGRLLIEAARRHQRVVQVGTQSRSAPHVQAAMEKLAGGAIGDVLTAKVWNSQLRRDIGRRQPEPPPAGLDFDLWLGPAPAQPYRSNLLHASWRWFHAFGAGDMGNDGVHDIDLGVWGLGVGLRHPDRIAALGGKYFFDDDQEFPDTQNVLFEYDLGGGKKKQLIYEQRLWSPYVQEGHENGDAYYGTGGCLVLGKAKGWQIFGKRNAPGEAMMNGKVELDVHHRNFFDCIRTGARPAADIEIHHYSASLCHLGNIATRLARTLNFDRQAERFIGDDEANALVRRQYRPGHWAVPKGV
jgi:predicted dehydrogenase